MTISPEPVLYRPRKPGRTNNVWLPLALLVALPSGGLTSGCGGQSEAPPSGTANSASPPASGSVTSGHVVSQVQSNVNAPSGGTQAGKTVRVLAAASLVDAFKQIDSEFEKQHPGYSVQLSTGASSRLRFQVQSGLQASAFASADQKNMDPLVRAGIALRPQVFAHNQLVVVTPPSDPKVRSLKDLANGGVRLVVTPPEVPIGHYTQIALNKISGPAGLGFGFATRVSKNIVSREPNVRSLLAKVEMGEADAAIVYASDAASARRKVTTIAIPGQWNVEASYPIAVLKSAPDLVLASAYVKLVLSPAGQQKLKAAGFTPATGS